jgi:hypothetical protein
MRHALAAIEAPIFLGSPIELPATPENPPQSVSTGTCAKRLRSRPAPSRTWPRCRSDVRGDGPPIRAAVTLSDDGIGAGFHHGINGLSVVYLWVPPNEVNLACSSQIGFVRFFEPFKHMR